MKRKVIGLLRVSTEAQARPEREGLPAQRRVCEQVAKAHGLEIADWVEFQGLSGAAVLQDTRFRELLARLKRSDIAGIVVADFDRLFRRGRFSDYAILDAFADTGSLLYASDGVYNPSEDSGGLLGVLRGELAGMERRRIVERTRRGREEKRRRLGQRAEGPVGMPRGVTFDHQTGKWGYVWPEAERVRECFRLFLSGIESFAEIGRRVGIGGDNPSSAVRSVLRQPLYAGIYRVDRRWIKGRPIPRDPDDTYQHKVICDPLISEKDFNRVQRRLRELRARRPPVRDPDERPGDYSGFLRCAICGSSMLVAIDSRGYAGYRCGRDVRRSARCETGQTSVRLADSQLDAALGRMLGSEETLNGLIEASYENAEKEVGLDPRSIARKITELENRRSRAMDAYEKGAYELPELTKRLAAIDGELGSLRELQERSSEAIELDPDLLAQVIEVFGSWCLLERCEKRDLLRAYRISIHVSRPARRILHVNRVDIGLLADVALYKKMRRHGIT
jgi:DNA invertase Pin-like site-specific DNA recombinase